MFTPGSRACVYENASGQPNWPSRDPIGEAGGVNVYSFTRNSPNNFSDPLGLAGVAIGLPLLWPTAGGAASTGVGFPVAVGIVVIGGAAILIYDPNAPAALPPPVMYPPITTHGVNAPPISICNDTRTKPKNVCIRFRLDIDETGFPRCFFRCAGNIIAMRSGPTCWLRQIEIE
jgi:hypothetical protein